MKKSNRFLLLIILGASFSALLSTDQSSERNITIEQQIQQVVITFKNFYQGESLFNASSKQVDVMTLKREEHIGFGLRIPGCGIPITYGQQFTLKNQNGSYKEAVVAEEDKKQLTAELKDAKTSDTKSEDKYVRYNLITQAERIKAIMSHELNLHSVKHERKQDDLIVSIAIAKDPLENKDADQKKN